MPETQGDGPFVFFEHKRTVPLCFLCFLLRRYVDEMDDRFRHSRIGIVLRNDV